MIKPKFFSLSVLLALAALMAPPVACGYLFYGSDARTIYIAQPIMKAEYTRLTRLRINGVMFWQGGDEHLFADAGLFPHLSEVTFRFDDPDYVSKLDNCSASLDDPGSFTQMIHGDSMANSLDKIMTTLAANYPHIKTLAIYRKAVISEDWIFR